MQVNEIEVRIADLEARLEAAAIAQSQMLFLVSKWDVVTGETTYYERPTGRKPSWRNASPELYAELEQARRELYQQTVKVFVDNPPRIC